MIIESVIADTGHQEFILETTRIIFKKRDLPEYRQNKLNFKKIRCKRCHYSERDIELMNQMNLEHQKYKNLNRYYSDSNSKSISIKQPKIRDYIKHHEYRNTVEPSYETEILNVNIGDLVNLTCNVNTKEIDWYFMDTNKTTTELSKGLQLYVSDRMRKNFENQILDVEEFTLENNQIEIQRTPLVKYKVTSDGLSTHTLTVYIESKRDEGSYQCIDSFSDSPLKKKISVHLSKHFK